MKKFFALTALSAFLMVGFSLTGCAEDEVEVEPVEPMEEVEPAPMPEPAPAPMDTTMMMEEDTTAMEM